MRVVEPSQFKHSQEKKEHKRFPKTMFAACLVIALIGSVWFMSNRSSAPSPQQNEQVQATQDNKEPEEELPPQTTQSQPTLRQFTDNEFKVFYDNLLLPNLTRVENPPVISGNDIADARIRKIAEDRGYRLRSSPTVTLSSVDGFPVQAQVIESWRALKAAAAKSGLSMGIVSAYRSVDDQRKLFLQRLAATGATIEQVATGIADDKVNEVLITSSIPGYSKHHTGYTLDFSCAGYAFENFKNSPCQTWIAADNYKVAKENGFIPSYPPLADVQGPDPEAWEYVWVGTDQLYQ